jgi:hypothetical protein
MVAEIARPEMGRTLRCAFRIAATLGIAIVGREEAAAETLYACDIAARDAAHALALSLEPRRLLATLRA